MFARFCSFTFKLTINFLNKPYRACSVINHLYLITRSVSPSCTASLNLCHNSTRSSLVYRTHVFCKLLLFLLQVCMETIFLARSSTFFKLPSGPVITDLLATITFARRMISIMSSRTFMLFAGSVQTVLLINALHMSSTAQLLMLSQLSQTQLSSCKSKNWPS